MSPIIDVYSRVGPGRPHEAREVDGALHDMDQSGITAAWIHPSDAYAAVRNREGNELIAAAVRAHPDRFVGCAVANPWLGQGTVDELRRAFGRGLRALFLNPPVQGFQLDDELVDPLIGVATEAGAPVLAYTGTPVCAMPLQLAALARRHPTARFVMIHMGYADFWYDGAPAATTAPNIWLETSVVDPDLLLDAISRLGAERFLFGTSAPLATASVELGKVMDLGLPPDALAKVLHLNAKALLP
jgi:uncharacterized protein